ncbi:MAG: diguanylate cyclase [Algicola sp.]|nr:diguanylate cyclase [Algicola sp.]
MRLRKTVQRTPIVLVVDDTPANLTLMRNILEPQSYKVLLATSGEKALELLTKVTPDLIMLDIMMPGIDGFETLTRLKKIPSAKDIPVIFVTAKTAVSDIVRGFELGAVDYITKPIQRLEALARTKVHLKIQHLIHIERIQSEQIKAIINNISDCVLVSNKNGAIESVNPATEHLFGYCENILCHKNIAELLDYQGRPTDFIDVLLNHDSGDAWWQHPNGKNVKGKTFPIEINVREMYTHDPCFVIVIQDISLHRHEIDQLHHLTETDPLTNINNRRHFEILFAQSWQHCKRSNQMISVLFLDVDHFKSFNDDYGHQAGDSCLQAIATALFTSLSRGVDSVSRYGGEEFVAILPDTDNAGARKVAQIMLEAIEQLNIPHKHSKYGHITISIGVATCDYDADHTRIKSAKALLKLADKALYDAKAMGRNRVEHL